MVTVNLEEIRICRYGADKGSKGTARADPVAKFNSAPRHRAGGLDLRAVNEQLGETQVEHRHMAWF
jgi:hypothetical protein